MRWALWVMAGAAFGAVVALWGARVSIRRSVRGTIRAERRARDAERLAEIGAMTSGLAHEIKNPLSTIGLNAQLLGEGIDELTGIPAKDRDRLGRRVASLSREAERLRDILEDFLRYAGEFRLEPRRVDLAETVREFADFFEPQAEQQGVKLVVEAPSVCEGWADAGAVKQALLNLALNGVQAMTDDRAWAGTSRRLVVSVAPGRDEDLGEVAVVRVADEGPGVPPERRGEIFRPYITGRRSGAGLGLAITKRMVEEQGGRITVEANHPRGASFVIMLPRRAPGAGEI